jgi:hypothetical protein
MEHVRFLKWRFSASARSLHTANRNPHKVTLVNRRRLHLMGSGHVHLSLWCNRLRLPGWCALAGWWRVGWRWGSLLSGDKLRWILRSICQRWIEGRLPKLRGGRSDRCLKSSLIVNSFSKSEKWRNPSELRFGKKWSAASWRAIGQTHPNLLIPLVCPLATTGV